jgi:hypothetical protein
MKKYWNRDLIVVSFMSFSLELKGATRWMVKKNKGRQKPATAGSIPK